MSSTDIVSLLKTAGFSSLAGLRSFAPLALLSYHLVRQPVASQSWVVQRVGSKVAAGVLLTMAAGELVGDKLPKTPARTATPLLIGRIILGGGTGALFGMLHDQPAWVGAALGGVAAAASTFVSYHLRRALVEALHVPDPVIAVLEDGIVLVSGWQLLNAHD